MLHVLRHKGKPGEFRTTSFLTCQWRWQVAAYQRSVARQCFIHSSLFDVYIKMHSLPGRILPYLCWPEPNWRHTHTRAHTRTHTRTHAHTRTDAHTHRRTRTRTHAHTHTHPRTHTPTHTHTGDCNLVNAISDHPPRSSCVGYLSVHICGPIGALADNDRAR